MRRFDFGSPGRDLGNECVETVVVTENDYDEDLAANARVETRDDYDTIKSAGSSGARRGRADAGFESDRCCSL